MLSKNVIGIDFGASFTKVAYRVGFTEGAIEMFEDRASNLVWVDGDQLVPSLAIETGRERSPWIFGKQAASMKPGPGMTVYRNWKAQLLRADGAGPSETSLKVAHAFFGWLLKSVATPDALPFDPQNAAVMLAVPAFENNVETLVRLAGVMEVAGWGNQFMLRTTEPKANTIGFCTKGRNIRTIFDTPNWNGMFAPELPFIQFTLNHLMGGDPATLAVLDIGSFTSDLSLINWHPGATEGYLDDGLQKSFRHGIVEQLDSRCLPEILNDANESIDSLDFLTLEALKKDLYHLETYELGGFTLGGGSHRELLEGAIETFCDDLWELIHPHLEQRPVHWFLLTGGGVDIPLIRRRLGDRFRTLTNHNHPPMLLDGVSSRVDTAIGATSLILFTGMTQAEPGTDDVEPPEETPLEPLPPLRNCSCQGLNPDCMRCGGRGIIQDYVPARSILPRLGIQPQPSPEDSEEGLREDEAPDFEPEDVTPPDDSIGGNEKAVAVTKRELTDYTLEGWMGTLVFGTQIGSGDHNYQGFKKTLTSTETEVRNAAWYRLLCFACALGAKVPRSTIRAFWETTLEQTRFWEITTGPTHTSSELDKFFENLIHREFRSIYAEGEQAELLRRVFYDFRKLHFLTYENDFAGVILEILAGVGNGCDPIRFLRSGWLPNDRPWRGVIGQSMTSPLLFLMREWRRMGLVASNRMDHHCYYMNAAARRGAYRKGWLKVNQLYAYSLPDILDASRTVHAKLIESVDWDPMHFDIPLQINGGRRRRRRT